MTPETWADACTALIVAGGIFSALAWLRNGDAFLLGAILLVASAATIAWLAPASLEPGKAERLLITVGAASAATLGGGPLTSRLFSIIDDAGAPGTNHQLENAAKVLRGGAWIGVFERLSVFAAALLNVLEAIAVVLALKGVGRYQELQGGVNGAAERFIIGTFSSLLWSLAVAGLTLKLT